MGAYLTQRLGLLAGTPFLHHDLIAIAHCEIMQD